MTSTRQIEADLCSARTGVNDPLGFPAIRIIGSNFTVELSESHSTPEFDLQDRH